MAGKSSEFLVGWERRRRQSWSSGICRLSNSTLDHTSLINTHWRSRLRRGGRERGKVGERAECRKIRFLTAGYRKVYVLLHQWSAFVNRGQQHKQCKVLFISSHQSPASFPFPLGALQEVAVSQLAGRDIHLDPFSCGSRDKFYQLHWYHSRKNKKQKQHPICSNSRYVEMKTWRQAD